MNTKIKGEQQVQILSPNFSISPSNEDYVLNISANGKDFSPLFAVSAGVTRLVSNVAPGSYYKLVGNRSDVVINWQRMCATEGGGASGRELIPVTEFPLDAEAGTVVSLVSGDTMGLYQYDGNEWSEVSPDLSAYWTSAETQSAITAVEDHVYDYEQVTASALTELHDDILELSARTVDLSPYYTSAQTEDAILAKHYITSAQAEDQIIAKNYVVSGEVEDQIVAKNYITSGQAEDQILAKNYVVSGQVEDQILAKNYVVSAQVEDQIIAKNYVTSAQTEDQILGKNYVVSAQVEDQIVAKNYVTSAQTEDQILAKHYITSGDIEPDVIYEAQGSDPGFYAVNSSALTSWQLENLDLSGYKFVRFYVKASDIEFNSSDNFTAPLYVDVVLDPKSLSSQYQAYLGVTTNICAGNRNRSFHVIGVVDITKSKLALLYETTLWDISVSDARNNGRYCYRVEGYKYNVCGAAEQGGGGGSYSAGANINISPANVISVSGLSTINGSALTDGSNLVIDTASLRNDIDTMDTVVSAALVELNDTKVESADVKHMVKMTQAQYDALAVKDPYTFYIIID